MKKINVDAIAKDIFGEEAKRPLVGSEGQFVPCTIAWVLVEALGASEKKLSATEQLSVYMLQKRIWKGGEIEFSTEEVVKLKDAVANFIKNIKQSGPILELLES